MGRVYEAIEDHQRDWIARQAMFFVATAPLDPGGHVNVSPKGPIGSLRVLDGHTIAYLDVVGSGAETIAHLRENGRIVVMLCAFEGPPRVLRLHGRGEPIAPADPRFDELVANAGFDVLGVPEGKRAIVLVDVTRVADSCGYGVPLMSFEGDREHMERWGEKKLRSGGPEAFDAYKHEKNSASIDGLPAVSAP